MTLEEAKKIRACNGRGYSYVDFIRALQLTEPNPPTYPDATPKAEEPTPAK